MRYMLLVSCFLICSCTLQDGSRIETFGYVFHETTGITRGIIKNGQEIKIKFSNDSDSVALRTLTSLKWFVLYPSGDGNHIFVEGHLDNKIQWTQNHPNMAKSKPFQEFKLNNWYIVTPFKRINFVEEWSPETFVKVSSNSLEPSDFETEDAIDGIDLAQFRRNQRP